MAVGLRVESIVDEIGASSFLNAFFSTVSVVLEAENPGSRYPVISFDLFEGYVPVEKVKRPR